MGFIWFPRDSRQFRNPVSPLFENHKYCADDQSKAGEVIPLQLLVEIEDRENGKHRKRDDFLNGFQLRHAEFVGADAVGGNLEAVFEERDHPTDDDDLEERRRFVFEVTVPGKCHEDVGAGQEQDRSHARYVARIAKLLPEAECLFWRRGADPAPVVIMGSSFWRFVREAELLPQPGDGAEFRAVFHHNFGSQCMPCQLDKIQPQKPFPTRENQANKAGKSFASVNFTLTASF